MRRHVGPEPMKEKWSMSFCKCHTKCQMDPLRNHPSLCMIWISLVQERKHWPKCLRVVARSCFPVSSSGILIGRFPSVNLSFLIGRIRGSAQWSFRYLKTLQPFTVGSDREPMRWTGKTPREAFLMVPRQVILILGLTLQEKQAPDKQEMPLYYHQLLFALP